MITNQTYHRQRKLIRAKKTLVVLLPVFVMLFNTVQGQVTITKPAGVIQYTIKKEAVTDPADIIGLAANEKVKSLQYVDGFNRPVEAIVAGGSPGGKDMISFTQYDELGRVSKAYLPYEASTTTGVYTGLSTAITDQAEFYTSSALANKVAYDNSPFSQTVFENSPLQRVLKQGNVGDGFQPDQHYKSMVYRVNTGSGSGEDKVLNWNSGGTANAYYAAGDLSALIGTDEAGNETTVFKDKLGRLILKRQKVETGVYADTYYGYDNANNVIYILPPKAIKKMQDANTLDISVTPKLNFYFWYDSKNRVIRKKVPGAEEVYMIYDPLDRLVLMQDGNMRHGSGKNWLYFKYDNANRVIIQGMYVHGTVLDQDQMQNHVDGQNCYGTNSTSYYEIRQNGTASGYSNQCFPTSGTEERQFNYFDDYDFDFNGTADYSKLAQGLTNEADATANTYGLPTGTKKRILGSSDWLIDVSFYDKYYHVIQVRSNNQLKTAVNDHTTNVVDFSGKVILAKQVKHINNPTGIVNDLEIDVSTRYEYDDMGRLLKVFQTNPGQSELTVANYQYNPLGQLVDKKLHSTNGTNYLQSVDYRYNIRGQLTSINNSKRENDEGTANTNDDDDDLFGMELFYDKEDANPGIGNRVNFTGMISGIKWSAITPSTNKPDTKSFIYSYDRLYRLVLAEYKAKEIDKDEFDKDAGGFNESFSYDLNGNITALERSAVLNNNTVKIDDLAYTYKTSDKDNQLDNIADAITATGPEYGFRNINNSTGAYTYDDNGNLETDPKKGTTITYNELNKPTRIQVSSTKKVEFRYDASGVRLSKYVYENSTVKYFEYIGGYVIENDILSYYAMAEGRVRNDGNGYGLTLSMEYFISDQQGNVRLSFEDDGTNSNKPKVTQVTDFYAFGMQMAGGSTPSANPNKRLYNGGSEWQDDIDGFSDYYSTFFREYDAVIGRFNGVDPVAVITDEISTYAYVGNNPIMMNDPLGDRKDNEKEKTLAQIMQEDYRNWHDSRYGSGMRDIADAISQQYGLPAWGNGGGEMSPFSSFGLYAGLKAHLGMEGIPNKVGFNKWGEYGYWKNFVGENYDGGEGNMTGVTVGARFFTLRLPFYETPEAAAKGWGLFFNNKSINADKEYGGVIFSYPVNGRKYYSFNVPNIGSAGNVIFRKTIPRGATIIGWIHSHAAYKSWTDDHLSYPGLSYISQSHYDIDQYGKYRNEMGGGEYFMFLTTPSGYLRMWEPGQGTSPVEVTLWNYNTGGSFIVDPKYSPGKSNTERQNTNPAFWISINAAGALGTPIK